MKKKFFQNYVLTFKEEIYVIMKYYIKDNGYCEGYLDMVVTNLFCNEEDFGKNKVDTSNCYLVSKELNSFLDNVVTLNSFEDISLKVDEDATIKELYSKFVGSSKVKELIERDNIEFSNDTSWYKENSLFERFLELD